MKKTKIAIVLGLVFVLAITMGFVGCKTTTAETAAATTAAATTAAPATTAAAETTAAATTAAPKVHSNAAEFTKIADVTDMKAYYAQYGVTCDATFLGKGGDVAVKGLPKVLPTPDKKYKIGLALYFTVDETGANVLEGTQAAADKMGIELVVNDANYDQAKQDQAVEQWILEGIDGVLFYPADFTACGPILQKLADAKIPVMCGNPPLTPSTVNSVFTIDNVQIGRDGAQLLLDTIKASGGKMEGTVVFQNLPFLHPNAATRKAGFLEVMAKQPLIKVVELTGITPEEHYKTFEGAMQAYPDMIGAWGLYSSAVVGMSNARKAAGKTMPIVGVDQDRIILAGIFNDEIVGTVGYNPYNHAYWTLDNMVNILNGVEDYPGQIIGPIETVTKANVEDMFKMYWNGKTIQDYLAGQ
jgi:ribose transport system substrate-binding protein